MTKTEERSLVAAVNRFRACDDGSEPAALAGIEATACSDGPDGPICATKAKCLAYARPTTSAKVAMSEVKKTLDADASVDPTSKTALNAKLSAARTDLETGHAALDACDHALQDLRLKYER